MIINHPFKVYGIFGNEDPMNLKDKFDFAYLHLLAKNITERKKC